MGTKLTRIESDVQVFGTVSATGMVIPDGTVDDDAVSSVADISADKMEHRHRVGIGEENAAASDKTVVVYHVVSATATVRAFEAGSIVAATGDATVTVDLQKNGSTILSAVITLDSGNTAYVPEAGTISSAGLVDGDVLTIVVDATIGTGTLPTGLYAYADVDEKGV